MKFCPEVRASFELLGACPGDSPAELKKAFHKMAMAYHPDRNSSATANNEFIKITEAYELLLDAGRVQDLNKKYQKARLQKSIVEGLDFTFGSFFGYRSFQINKHPKGSAKFLTSKKQSAGSFYEFGAAEEDVSILDNPAFDAIEVVYAGRFQEEDEKRLLGELKQHQLPWVVINNQGIQHFFAGDIKRAKICYLELCERVPNNILFLYRLGLCWIVEGFRQPRRTLLGVKQADKIKIEKGLLLLRRCIQLGEERPVGKQRCLMIRKLVADVYGHIGKNRLAKKQWTEILRINPNSVEATLHVHGKERAERLDQQRSKIQGKRQKPNQSQNTLLLERPSNKTQRKKG